VLVVPVKVAETFQYASNVFRALQVTFANEIGIVSKRQGIESHPVTGWSICLSASSACCSTMGYVRVGRAIYCISSRAPAHQPGFTGPRFIIRGLLLYWLYGGFARPLQKSTA
jgi:UDP-glucose/GDP-mannose dehydrogenase family, central domain